MGVNFLLPTLRPGGDWKRNFQNTHAGQPSEMDLKLSSGNMLEAGGLPRASACYIILELFIHPDSERKRGKGEANSYEVLTLLQGETQGCRYMIWQLERVPGGGVFVVVLAWPQALRQCFMVETTAKSRNQHEVLVPD